MRHRWTDRKHMHAGIAGLVMAAGLIAVPAVAGPSVAAVAAVEPTPLPAGPGCPPGMRVWVPSANALASGDPLALAPASMSAHRRVEFGRQVLRLLAGHHVRWLGSSGCGHALTHSTAGAAQPVPSTSNNWSGYQSDANNFTGVSMVWNVPAAQSTASPAMMSIWPGIGQGSSGDLLIQAGTEQEQGSAPFMWTEVVPGQLQQPVSGLSVTAGDRVAVNVSWDSASHTVAFLLINYTTGVVKMPTQTVSGSSGSSAEWIVERTEKCGNGKCFPGIFPNLLNFGSVQIQNGAAQQTTINNITTGGYIGSFASLSAISMQACVNTPTMATVSGVSSTGTFTDSFQAPGHVDPGHCQWTISPASAAFSASLSNATVTLVDTTAKVSIGCGTSTISGTTSSSPASQVGSPAKLAAINKISIGNCVDQIQDLWSLAPPSGFNWSFRGDVPSLTGVTKGHINGTIEIDVTGKPLGEPCSFKVTGTAPAGDVTYTNSTNRLLLSTSRMTIGNVTGVGCSVNGLGIRNNDAATFSAAWAVTSPSNGISIQPDAPGGF